MTDLNNQVSPAKTVEELHTRAILLAMQEISEVIRDLAIVIAQRENASGNRIGGCAAGLERAAHRVRFGNLTKWVPDLPYQFDKLQAELVEERKQNMALRAKSPPTSEAAPVPLASTAIPGFKRLVGRYLAPKSQ